MGASVGVGALIVGVSMLVVFALAVESFENEVKSAVAEVESSAEALPSIRVDATLVSGAILHLNIDDDGTSNCVDGTGTLSASSAEDADEHGFTGTWTTTGGVITSVTITTHGTYSALPTIGFDTTPTGCTSSVAVSVPNNANGGHGNMIFLNITNEGETLETSGLWLSADGGEPVAVSNNYTSSDFIYPEETIFVKWAEASNTNYGRLAVNAMGTTKVDTL